MAPQVAPKVFIAEDDEGLRSALEIALARAGCDVATAADGETALRRLREISPDLVVLDVLLPRRSGLEVLRTLRSEGRTVPVIVLSGKSQEADKVHGLDLGADDYVTKPFGLAELLARVRARLRARAGGPKRHDVIFAVGDARVDLGALIVRRDAREHPLTSREAEMLALLYRERGRVVSRARFLDEVWSGAWVATARTIDQHVAKLRRKLERNPARPRHLVTVFGVGYRLDIERERSGRRRRARRIG